MSNHVGGLEAMALDRSSHLLVVEVLLTGMPEKEVASPAGTKESVKHLAGVTKQIITMVDPLRMTLAKAMAMVVGDEGILIEEGEVALTEDEVEWTTSEEEAAGTSVKEEEEALEALVEAAAASGGEEAEEDIMVKTTTVNGKEIMVKKTSTTRAGSRTVGNLVEAATPVSLTITTRRGESLMPMTKVLLPSHSSDQLEVEAEASFREVKEEAIKTKVSRRVISKASAPFKAEAAQQAEATTATSHGLTVGVAAVGDTMKKITTAKISRFRPTHIGNHKEMEGTTKHL